ncbi:MAG: hypothetical protein DI498_13775 [Paracoccus denitrificans]|nr:MAG: hypothetical protein DI498_13775 [Paracoccus denitrificans]PZO82876.1 MAG: hypothetical protein DI633_13775 [Paracoccus denitrificans]
MDRLGEYLQALAQFLGEKANVHLAEVKEGSVAVNVDVDAAAQLRVAERIQAANSPDAPKDLAKAFDVLDEMLRKDNATGSLRDWGERVIIPFPGIKRKLPPVFGPIRQEGSLTGQVVRVGGKDATIPVHLRDGDTVLTGLTANEDMARRLAHHYLGGRSGCMAQAPGSVRQPGHGVCSIFASPISMNWTMHLLAMSSLGCGRPREANGVKCLTPCRICSPVEMVMGGHIDRCH